MTNILPAESVFRFGSEEVHMIFILQFKNIVFSYFVFGRWDSDAVPKQRK